MIKIENPHIFTKCVADALTTIDANNSLNTGEKLRVVNAVAKAVRRIEADGCFMDYDGDAEQFVIWSQSSNVVYTLGPDNRHGCPAELSGVICWHKAAKRLLVLYNSAILAALSGDYAVKSDFTDMPYLKNTDRLPAESFGGVRI